MADTPTSLTQVKDLELDKASEDLSEQCLIILSCPLTSKTLKVSQ